MHYLPSRLIYHLELVSGITEGGIFVYPHDYVMAI